MGGKGRLEDVIDWSCDVDLAHDRLEQLTTHLHYEIPPPPKKKRKERLAFVFVTGMARLIYHDEKRLISLYLGDVMLVSKLQTN